MIRLNDDELETVKTTKEYDYLLKLKRIAVDFLKTEYNLDLYAPIEISNRMKKTLGIFIYQETPMVITNSYGKHTYPIYPVAIRLSGDMLRYYTEAEVIDTLKHELVHYALGMLGKPFSDGDKYFKDELKRLGVSRTGVGESKGLFHIYECTGCKKSVQRNSKGYEKKYVCGSCESDFIYIGEKIIK